MIDYCIDIVEDLRFEYKNKDEDEDLWSED